MINKCLVNYIPFLQTMARRYRFNNDDRQDLVQNTLLRILQGTKNLDEIDEAKRKAWLTSVIHNVNVDYVRRSVLSNPVSGEVNYVLTDNIASAVSFNLGPQFILATLYAAIDSFPKDQQKVVISICLNGKEVVEVAKEKKCHLSDVYRVLYKARQAVRDQYRNFSVFETRNE